jgi:hypothetical protein
MIKNYLKHTHTPNYYQLKKLKYLLNNNVCKYLNIYK